MAPKAVAVILLCLAACLPADEPQLKHREPLPQNGVAAYRVEQGQRIPVRFLSTVSTRTAAHGDRVYLETVFPVVVLSQIVIPAGSYINAEVTEVRRAGREKAAAELVIRLGQLTLPNARRRELQAGYGRIIATTTTTRGTGLAVMPGTTADIVLEDPIVFSVEEVRNR